MIKTYLIPLFRSIHWSLVFSPFVHFSLLSCDIRLEPCSTAISVLAVRWWVLLLQPWNSWWRGAIRYDCQQPTVLWQTFAILDFIVCTTGKMEQKNHLLVDPQSSVAGDFWRKNGRTEKSIRMQIYTEVQILISSPALHSSAASIESFIPSGRLFGGKLSNVTVNLRAKVPVSSPGCVA